MKRLLIFVFALTLICLPALAEPQIDVQTVGQQTVGTDGYAQEISILRIDIADGERTIPSVYALTQTTGLTEEETLCTLEDVNFDGYDDLVVVTMAGASNGCFTFYLWNPETGTYEGFGGDDLWNYQLYPAQRIVVSHGTSGWAGLLHQTDVYGWDETGRSLKLLRSSVWDTFSETDLNNEGEYLSYVERHDESQLVETYTDYENDTEYSVVNPTKRYEDPVFSAARFQEESDFLDLQVTQDDQNDGSNG